MQINRVDVARLEETDSRLHVVDHLLFRDVGRVTALLDGADACALFVSGML